MHFLTVDRYLNVNVCVCDAIFPFIGFADVPPVLLSGLSGIFILLSNRSVSLKFAVARSLKKKLSSSCNNLPSMASGSSKHGFGQFS